MYLTDYHSHSLCSHDSTAPLSEMVTHAVRAGIQELCTTDHYDLLEDDGSAATPLDWAPIIAQYESALSSCPRDFTLRLGLELGCGQLSADYSHKLLAEAPLDYVIGSIHNVNPDLGGQDIYFMPHSSKPHCHIILDNYLTQMAEIAATDLYDCLGHVIYPLRYMPLPTDTFLTPTYHERLREIFKTVAQNGRGIEFNTNRGADITPWLPYFQLYRDCGGEIVTIGSDSHTPDQLIHGNIVQAQQLLQQVGFRYHAIYEKRIPQFVKL